MAKRLVLVEVDANMSRFAAGMASGDAAIDRFVSGTERMGSSTDRSIGLINRLAQRVATFGLIAKSMEVGSFLANGVVQADRMNIALKNVTAATNSYGQSQVYLDNLTNKYGQSLLNTQKQYTQFIAASNSSNLALQDRQYIFSALIKTGAAYQMSNAAIEKSLYAVNQMFSKGYIASEELRQQLGDHLPGAYSLMAKAVGVSEQQLQSMMKKGLVPAGENLMKFARLLESMNGETAARNLETVSGSFNRLTNEVLKQMVAFNESAGVTKGIASALNFLADNAESALKVIGSVTLGFVAYKAAAALVSQSSREVALSQVAATASSNTYLKSISNNLTALVAANPLLRMYAASLNLTTAATTGATVATRGLSVAVRAVPIVGWAVTIASLVASFIDWDEAMGKTSNTLSEVDQRIREYTADSEKQQVALGSLSRMLLEANGNIVEQERIFKRLRAEFPDIFGGFDRFEGHQNAIKEAIDKANVSIEKQIKLSTLLAQQDLYREKMSQEARRSAALEDQLGGASWDKRFRWKEAFNIFGSTGNLAVAAMMPKTSDFQAVSGELAKSRSSYEEYYTKLQEITPKISELQSRVINGPKGTGEGGEGKYASYLDLNIKKIQRAYEEWLSAEQKIQGLRNFSVGKSIISIEDSSAAGILSQSSKTNEAIKRYWEEASVAYWGGKQKFDAMQSRMSLTGRFGNDIKSLGDSIQETRTPDTATFEMNARYSAQQAINRVSHDIKEEMAYTLGDALALGFEAAFNKDFDFESGMKNLLGQFMKSIGTMFVKMGAAILVGAKAKTVAETSLATIFGGPAAGIGAIALMGIGAALIGGGSAISGSANRGSSSPGVASSAANGTYGSGFSYGSTPKVQVQVSGDFRIKGTDLIGAIKNTNNVYGN